VLWALLSAVLSLVGQHLLEGIDLELLVGPVLLPQSLQMSAPLLSGLATVLLLLLLLSGLATVLLLLLLLLLPLWVLSTLVKEHLRLMKELERMMWSPLRSAP